MKKLTIKGWAFNKTVPSGLGNMPCVPFFRRKFAAETVAKDFMERRGLKLVPATLTLTTQPRKKKK